MRWVDALKEWNNSKSGTWCIPRKGSEQYKAVRAIMDKSKEKAKKIDEAPAPVKEAKKRGTKGAKKGPAPDFEVEVEEPKKMSLVEQERAEARQRQAVRDFFAKKK